MSRKYEKLLNREDALTAGRLRRDVISRLWDSMGRLDLEGAKRELAEMKSVAEKFGSEPARMTNQIVFLQCAAALADTYVETEEYESAYNLALATWEDLLSFQARMRDLGIPSEGSKAQISLVITIAQLKWQSPTYLDCWPNCADLHQQYYKAANRVIDYNLRATPSFDSQSFTPDTLDLLHDGGGYLARLDYIGDRVELDRLLAFLGQRLGLQLSPDCRAFKDSVSAGSGYAAYWDFEIAKMIADRVGSLAEFDFCCKQRHRLLAQRIGDCESLLRREAWERKHFRRGLELAPILERCANGGITAGRPDGGA